MMMVCSFFFPEKIHKRCLKQTLDLVSLLNDLRGRNRLFCIQVPGCVLIAVRDAIKFTHSISSSALTTNIELETKTEEAETELEE